MKYSRKEIDKAGKVAMSAQKKEEFEEAENKINDWRQLHLIPLKKLQTSIIDMLKSNNQNIVFVSRRMKRLSSIFYKLDINPDMGLGGMQDIGGLRIVFADIADLYKSLNLLLKNIPQDFTLKDKISDYVKSPKLSGYRSIHLVYIYHSMDDYDGMRIELQIRTKLQHSWAMAVETAGLITKTPLKSSYGDGIWLNFFKIISSLFAIKEKQNILFEHKLNGKSMKDLMIALYMMDQRYNLSDQLKALRISVNIVKEKNFKNGYYILNINFINKTVHISAYNKTEEILATSKYVDLEKKAGDGGNAVVLVSVPKMIELQEAYPSYFLDTRNFLKAIDAIKGNCENYGYVKAK